MKHLKYMMYIIKHKWFVFVASVKIGSSLWLAVIHDLSKFKPCEWFPYAEYFYGNKKKTEALNAIGEFGLAELAPWGYYVKDRFAVAWLHHQKSNKHHWQYWLLTNDDNGETFPLPMPEKYIKEMIADWMGAGRAITGKWEYKEWFLKNKEKIIVHKDTMSRIYEIMEEKP